ncbi:ECF transporter S component [Natribacillus halophilus]|uniref:Riboflavin transporter n=1 Tax=Natribacillus halophilus TaxID=549003 RepID=A0A1G8M9X5_9BACI|nr:ECF transporter S component [Natribacillus halophilus]SDI64731.1 Riboflavin transporter FmnP [Natribacillus halophilus]
MKQTKTFRLVMYAVLGSMAAALMFFSFPMPMFLSFLSIDASELPVLFAALLFSPIAGIVVAGIKILLYTLFMGAGDPIGMVSNFMASLLFVLPVAYVYRHFGSVKGLIAGLGLATVFMAGMMALLNYLVFLPAYTWLMDFDLGSQGLLSIALAGILPFNLFKGLFISLLFIPLFLKLFPLLQEKSYGAHLQRKTAANQ